MVAYLSGELRQRRTGVGWASLRDLPPPAGVPELRVAEVDAALAAIAAAGRARVGRPRAARLLARPVRPRDRGRSSGLLRGLLTGELRQGALAGVMLDAVARAAGVPAAAVRRAAHAARRPRAGRRGGAAPAVRPASAAVRLQVGRPVQPMLAAPGDDVAAALRRHRARGGGVEARRRAGAGAPRRRRRWRCSPAASTTSPAGCPRWSRPRASPARPPRRARRRGDRAARPTVGRGRSRRPAAGSRSRVDVGGRPRGGPPVDVRLRRAPPRRRRPARRCPAGERFEVLARARPRGPAGPAAGHRRPGGPSAFVADALARGHEGVVVKALDAPYDAGRRGAGWVKVKPRHTLDLVVLAAEWGHGRRQRLAVQPAPRARSTRRRAAS